MYSLEVYGLTKRYGKTIALNDVSFSLRPGEALAILGPAESGKTTLVRLLSGLEQPDEGRIIINGKNITEIPAAERHIGSVMQDGHSLFPHLDVFENIAWSIQHNLPRKENRKEIMRQRVMLVAQSVQLEHLLHHKVSTLSEGEQLRVALARAVVKRPQLYLFDEPFMHLDTPTRLAARRELVELHRTTSTPCIYLTRDQPEAFALANEVIVMHQGEMQQIGTRADLFYAPATLWVAEWLGFPPMNTVVGSLQGTYKEDGIHYRVWSKSITPLLPLKWTHILDQEACQDAIIGIRPEDIIPEWEFQEKWNPTLHTVNVKILSSEWNQSKTLAQLQLPHIEDKFMAVFDIAHDRLKIGDIITVGFNPEQFCLFHPLTKRLLLAPLVMPNQRWRPAGNQISGTLMKHYRLTQPG